MASRICDRAADFWRQLMTSSSFSTYQILIIRAIFLASALHAIPAYPYCIELIHDLPYEWSIGGDEP